MSGGVAAALADLVFGDREPALRLLTTDAARRHWYATGSFFGRNPLPDPLWTDARFHAACSPLAPGRFAPTGRFT